MRNCCAAELPEDCGIFFCVFFSNFYNFSSQDFVSQCVPLALLILQPEAVILSLSFAKLNLIKLDARDFSFGFGLRET